MGRIMGRGLHRRYSVPAWASQPVTPSHRRHISDRSLNIRPPFGATNIRTPTDARDDVRRFTPLPQFLDPITRTSLLDCCIPERSVANRRHIMTGNYPFEEGDKTVRVQSRQIYGTRITGNRSNTEASGDYEVTAGSP